MAVKVVATFVSRETSRSGIEITPAASAAAKNTIQSASSCSAQPLRFLPHASTKNMRRRIQAVSRETDLRRLRMTLALSARPMAR